MEKKITKNKMKMTIKYQKIYGCIYIFVDILCHFSPYCAAMHSDKHCLEVSAVKGSTFRLDRCNDLASAGYFGG